MTLVTTKELAEAVGLKPHQVRYLANLRKIPFTRLGTSKRGHFLFDLDSAVKAIEKEIIND